MNVPGAGMTKATKENDVVGLNSYKLDESNVGRTVFKYIAAKPQAPTPKGTVGECKKMRERSRQMSLFPTIYRQTKVHHPGNVDFGNLD